jgi:hypothetical protein
MNVDDKAKAHQDVIVRTQLEQMHRLTQQRPLVCLSCEARTDERGVLPCGH